MNIHPIHYETSNLVLVLPSLSEVSHDLSINKEGRNTNKKKVSVTLL